jgi:predicted RNase H-like nuclease (RuvC/YqgF family)
MTKTSQLDLFASADECRDLQAENAWLKARLENAKVEYRKLREELHQQCLQATQDSLRIQELQRDVIQHRTMAEFWERQATLYQSIANTLMGGQGSQLHRTAPSKADLTKLLVLCHPDKWSQGQPATALAHEITVRLNQLRARLEGQP